MAAHKVSDCVAKMSYHVVTLVSKYPIKATSDTLSVDPLLLFQQPSTVGYRCAKVWTTYLSSSMIWSYWRMLQSDKPSQENAIQEWVHPSSTQFLQDVSYICDGGVLILTIPWKTGQTYESLCGRYIEYVKKRNMTNQSSFCLMAT